MSKRTRLEQEFQAIYEGASEENRARMVRLVLAMASGELKITPEEAERMTGAEVIALADSLAGRDA